MDAAKEASRHFQYLMAAHTSESRGASLEAGNPRLDEVLEMATKVSSQAEVFHLSHIHEPIIFEANKLKALERKESSGTALRLIKNGKIGFSSTTRQDHIVPLAYNVLETAPLGPHTVLEFLNYHKFNPLEIYDPSVESYPLDAMIELGQTIIDRVRKHEPSLLCDASVSEDVTTISIMDSNGGYANYTKSVFSISVGGTLIKDTDILFLW